MKGSPGRGGEDKWWGGEIYGPPGIGGIPWSNGNASRELNETFLGFWVWGGKGEKKKKGSKPKIRTLRRK